MRKDWGKRGKRLEIYLHFNRNLSRERLKITFIGNFIDALVSIALQSSGIRVRELYQLFQFFDIFISFWKLDN